MFVVGFMRNSNEHLIVESYVQFQKRAPFAEMKTLAHEKTETIKINKESNNSYRGNTNRKTSKRPMNTN